MHEKNASKIVYVANLTTPGGSGRRVICHIGDFSRAELGAQHVPGCPPYDFFLPTLVTQARTGPDSVYREREKGGDTAQFFQEAGLIPSLCQSQHQIGDKSGLLENSCAMSPPFPLSLYIGYLKMEKTSSQRISM